MPHGKKIGRALFLALVLGIMIGTVSAQETVVTDFEDSIFFGSGDTSYFSTQSNTVYSESQALEKTSNDANHDFIYESTSNGDYTEGDNVTVRAYQPDLTGGVFISDGSGNGYVTYVSTDNIRIFQVDSGTLGDQLTDITQYSTNDDWVEIKIQKDGSSLKAWILDNNGNILQSVSASDSTYNPDRTGIEAFSTGVKLDYLTIETDNVPPTIDSVKTDPTSWQLGENISVNYNASDSDRNVSQVCADVWENGSQIVSDECKSYSSGSVSDSFVDLFQVDTSDVHYNFTLTVTDNDGATSTYNQNQFISNDAPVYTLNSPTNDTKFTYDQNIDLTTANDDGDNIQNENYTCKFYLDGNQTDSTTLKEGGNTYTNSFRSDLGQHNFTSSCEDDSGNTENKTRNYTVKLEKLVGQTHPTPIYETDTPQSNIEVKLGDMVSKITAELVFNESVQESISAKHSGIGNEYLTAENNGVPLVKNNATDVNASWNYTVEYKDFNGDNASKEISAPKLVQTIYHAVFNPSVSSDSDRYIEKENPDTSYNYDTKKFNGSVSCTLSLNSSTANKCQTTSLDTGLANTNKETLTITGTGTASFQDKSRSIGQATKDIDVHKKIITDCNNQVDGVTGSQALNMTLLNEENRSQRLTGNIAYNLDITHHGEHTRNYAFDKNGVKNTETCIYPSWTEYESNGPVQYSSDASQNSLDTDFPDRQYNLINQTLDNNIDELDLYLLPDSLATPVYFEVKDQGGNGVSNAVVTVQRYFVGSNSYLTVAKSETDSEGIATTYLRVNEIYYKYTVKDQEGNILLETERQILTCQSSPCTKELRINPEEDNQYFEEKDGFSYNNSKIFDSDGNLTGFQATVSHDSSVFKKANLLVERHKGVSTETICNITASSNPSTLVCQFNEPAEDDNINYVLKGFTDGNTYLLDKGIINGSGNIFQRHAYFGGFLIFTLFSMIGLASPKTGIVFSTAGIIIPWYLGFYALSLSAVGSLALVALALLVTNNS